jgi:peroxiredoxin
MCHLQKLYEKYKDKGLVVLGIDITDDKKIALEFLRENGATFPTVLDSSDAAKRVVFMSYRVHGVPVSYVINAQHTIVDAWVGYQEGYKGALAALKKAGLKLEE